MKTMNEPPIPSDASPMTAQMKELLRAAVARCNQPGSEAKVWSYQVTLSMLHIRIKLPDGSIEHLRCGACSRLEFSTWWQDVQLSFKEEPDNPYGFRLFDEGAQFLVICGVVYVGPAPEEAVDV